MRTCAYIIILMGDRRIVIPVIVAVLILGTLGLGQEAWAPTLMEIGDLPGGSLFSRANAVSADGSVVVGTGVSDNGAEAFVWTQQDGFTALSDLPGGSFGSFGLFVY